VDKLPQLILTHILLYRAAMYGLKRVGAAREFSVNCRHEAVHNTCRLHRTARSVHQLCWALAV